MKKSTHDYVFVGIQFILFAIYIVPFSYMNFSSLMLFKIIGIALVIIGIIMGLLSVLQLSKNLSPFPTPVAGGSLIQTGLYKYIRHPIYTSILFTFIGYGLYTASGYKLGVTVVLFTLFEFKSRYEEEKLSAIFSEYQVYKKSTGRFLPRIFPTK